MVGREGDDMVFVDDDTWPPSIHGTGTEEVFGGGACPVREYSGPYHGFHLIEREDFAGLTGMYRWFVHDPLGFRKSIRWTIEHGHANNFANDYSSVAFWHQAEPHQPFSPLPERDEMGPSFPPEYPDARLAEFTWMARHIDDQAGIARVAESFYREISPKYSASPREPAPSEEWASNPRATGRRWPRSDPDDDVGGQIVESAKNGEGSDGAGSHVDR